MATPTGSGGDADETEQSARRLGSLGKGLAGDAADAVGGVAGAGKGLAGNAAGAVGGAASSLSGRGKGLAGNAADAVGGVAGAGKGLAGSAAGAVGSVGAAGAGMAAATSGKGGWRAFVPPNARGKFPWKWRWFLAPLILLACMLTGIWAWGHAESDLMATSLVHLECEGIDLEPDHLDWSYRSVTVAAEGDFDGNGSFPEGVTPDEVERIIEEGSDDRECLDNAGIDVDDDTRVMKATALGAAGLAAAAAIPDTPEPTAVPTPAPTAVPTATPEPEPTATPEPEPTATPEPVPAAAIDATASFDGQAITLVGLVGSEAQRDQLVAAAVAAVGADNVIDELTIDPGDPTDGSDARVGELATLIASYGSDNVVTGTASITEDATNYQFTAPSDAARDALDLPGEGTVSVPMAAAPAFTG